MPRYRNRYSKPMEKTKDKEKDNSENNTRFDVLREKIKKIGNQSESSQFHYQIQENIDNLIKEMKEEKAASQYAFLILQKDIKHVKSRLNEIQKGYNKKKELYSLIGKQLQIFKEEKLLYLEKLLSNNIDNVKKEIKFILEEKNNYDNIKAKVAFFIKGPMTTKKAFDNKSMYYGINIKTNNKDFESIRMLSSKLSLIGANTIESTDNIFRVNNIEDYNKLCKNLEIQNEQSTKNTSIAIQWAKKRYEQIDGKIDPILHRKLIEKYSNEVIEKMEQFSSILQDAMAEFVETKDKDFLALRNAYTNNLRRWQNYINDSSSALQTLKENPMWKSLLEKISDADKAYKHLEGYQQFTQSTLEILNGIYSKQLKCYQEAHKKMKEDLEIPHQAIQEELQSELQKIKRQSEELLEQAGWPKELLKQERLKALFNEALKPIEKLKELSNEVSKPIKGQDEILKEAADTLENYIQAFKRVHGENFQNIPQLISFYDLIEENIPHRLSNSLDELERKNQERLGFLEEQIKELEWLRSQRQSEQPDQSLVRMEESSAADQLQESLRTLLKDTKIEMTDQCKSIVTSYMRRLFEESRYQSLREFSDPNNLEEAIEVAKYIEQKRFITDKIRDDAIEFAVHVKLAFGFPLHHANIDDDFNIIKSDPSKDGSSSASRLDINERGKILKNGRVQRVYLIGFQDSFQASSSHAEAKPMALLAIQSTQTDYEKYGAGTPLPTGGVVDVRTALHTTRNQHNLYKATLAAETLQETHEKKKVDIQTLEPFESEAVPRSDYDITTFIGKVKDNPLQVIPQATPDGPESQETTGACMIDLEKLTSAVRQEVKSYKKFCTAFHIMSFIKLQVAEKAIGNEFANLRRDLKKEDDEKEKKNKTIKDEILAIKRYYKENNCKIHIDEFFDSTSMNMFAKYFMLGYREELGLTSKPKLL